jgi:hypothetical protein
VLLAAGGCVLSACGGRTSLTDTDETDAGPGGPASVLVVGGTSLPLHLSVGAHWEYRMMSGDYDIGVQERWIDRCETVTWQDCVTGETRTANTYVQTAFDLLTGKVEERYLLPTDSGLVRGKEVRVNSPQRSDTYSPPFQRVYSGEYVAGRVESHSHLMCRERDSGSFTDPREFRFTLLPPDSITVPFGTFQAVGAARSRTELPHLFDTRYYWYVPGVGKVLEEHGDYREELTDFIPGDSQCPP